MRHPDPRRILPGLALVLALALLPPLPALGQSPESGRLVIMGGGGFGSRADVYRAILEARQGTGPVCVIPTASAEPETSIRSAVNAFEAHGGSGAAVGIAQLVVDQPRSGADPAVAEALTRCSGFYFVGGVQSRIVDVLRAGGGSTPALEALLRRFREGAVVSGSSAGAAIMSDPMIAGGANGEMAGGVRRPTDSAQGSAGSGDLATVSIQPGLGFFPDALVDQHFLARGRFGRLLVAVLEMPEFDLGFGIDESTALVVESGVARPVGASAVVVVDARGARTSGGASSGVKLHLISAGDAYHLSERTVSLDPAKAPLERGPEVEAPEDLFSSWTFFHLLEGFARSSQTELSLPVPGGRIVLRKDAGFRGVAAEGRGVQGTAAGLSVTDLLLELHKDP